MNKGFPQRDNYYKKETKTLELKSIVTKFTQWAQ